MKLKTELPGILAWYARGCLAWQRDGLTLPAKVRAATSDYRQGEDRTGRFITERCLTGPDYRCKASELYGAFKAFCDAVGEHCPTQTTFGEALGRTGFERYTSNGTWYRGIALRDTEREHDFR